MSDMMIPFVNRPPISPYERKGQKVERHLEIRKTAEDEKDLTEENYHPAYDVMQQKHNSQQKDTDIDDDGQEHFDIFV
jgi:hypothetical protein